MTPRTIMLIALQVAGTAATFCAEFTATCSSGMFDYNDCATMTSLMAAGTPGDVTGNTLQCRTSHLAVAGTMTDSAMLAAHCSHASPYGGMDGATYPCSTSPATNALTDFGDMADPVFLGAGAYTSCAAYMPLAKSLLWGGSLSWYNLCQKQMSETITAAADAGVILTNDGSSTATPDHFLYEVCPATCASGIASYASMAD